jgi:tetratricopeptide (TPR) repeat protein
MLHKYTTILITIVILTLIALSSPWFQLKMTEVGRYQSANTWGHICINTHIHQQTRLRCLASLSRNYRILLNPMKSLDLTKSYLTRNIQLIEHIEILVELVLANYELGFEEQALNIIEMLNKESPQKLFTQIKNPLKLIEVHILSSVLTKDTIIKIIHDIDSDWKLKFDNNLPSVFAWSNLSLARLHRKYGDYKNSLEYINRSERFMRADNPNLGFDKLKILFEALLINIINDKHETTKKLGDEIYMIIAQTDLPSAYLSTLTFLTNPQNTSQPRQTFMKDLSPNHFLMEICEFFLKTARQIPGDE